MPSTSQDKVCASEIVSDGRRHSDKLRPPAASPHKTAAERFAIQAAKTPARTAVVQGGVQLTYWDLEIKSNQLAHWLRARDVQAETVVALCTTHTPNFIIGALGIWKAGGAYLPLDSELPAARVSYLLDDAGAPILLTEQKLERDFGANRCVMALDDESHSVRAMPRTAPERHNGISLDALAYVIYTSGSTGTPKGVEVTHGNLSNLVEWHQGAFGVTAADRATQLASLSFDAAVWEIWPYLTAGASVHFVPKDIGKAPANLRDWFIENKITIAFVPTLLGESLIELDWPTNTPLRAMLVGADVLHRYPSPDLPFQLVNNYGPTECTVVTTSGPIPARTASQSPPTIGRPISNAQVYVLDDNMRSVAPGIPGELFVGGAGVARGYRSRPDLTAERFIPNPLKSGTRERVYRTGDLVYMLPDGQLAFLGRSDEQIKVSGYRIEPNEIAHALARCQGVQAAYVTSREDTLGNKNLLGYVVARPEATLQSSKLRAVLQRELPAYMIPSDFVLLEQLPLTANGKIDRGLLPAPTPANLLTDSAFVAPRNAIEERLTDIVSGLLNLSRVSVEDNFFMLGGHSLLGTQLIGRVRDAFRVELSLRTIFDASTIAQLSLEIEKLLVAQVEALSENEAQALLRTRECEQLANEKNALRP